MKNRLLLATIALALTAGIATSQAATPKHSKKKEAQADTTKKAPKGSIEAVIKPTAVYNKGLLTVVKQDDKYYFLVPTAQLGRDLLLVNRISKAPADLRDGFIGYSGDEIAEAMIRFQLSPDKKNLFIENISTREIPRDSTGDMHDNVMRSNLQPLVWAFEVKGTNKSKDTVLVDVTDFLQSDNNLVSFDPWIKTMLNLSGYQKDKSYIKEVQSFPINTEIRTIKSFMRTPSGLAYNGRPFPSEPVTFELNTSIIELPAVPMQARYYDPRVGYFTERYIDFDKDPQGVKYMQLITRWRLEPKAEDVERYKAGELVEPVNPIIYYIDPTTPKKWIPYLIAGVNDWEPVFRKAGFKNAIKALEAPVDDSTWSLNDARHSAIVYKPSTIPNASGPHVHDPRTGQILESHINWYHNVMLLCRNWYMLQVGPNDVRAQQLTFPDSLMGDLIRFVSSHEVGHTLGLRHNFGATSTTPVDSLRSATYLAKNGHTPSIMDYSRFNYVVQPEDGIKPELQYPRIGEYDDWSIEWGYRRFPELTTPDAERAKLNDWVIEKQKNPRLWFGQESNPHDPRSQSEDLGDNQMKANALGIKNLKRVIAALPQWTYTELDNYNNGGGIYFEVLSQYNRYVGHVSKWIGGIYETPSTQKQDAAVYTFVEKEKQKEAMAWLNEYLFTAPTWLINQELFDRAGIQSTLVMTSVYSNAMRKLINRRVLDNLVEAEAALGAKAYTMVNLFEDLNTTMFKGVPNVNSRLMQKTYVDQLLSLIPAKNDIQNGRINTSDVTSFVMQQLRTLQSRFMSMTSSDAVTAAHYKYLAQRIKDTLDNK